MGITLKELVQSMTKLERLARGGPALQRGAYIVGEKGPEVFVPNKNGRVVPNHKLPGLLQKAAAAGKRLPRRAEGGEVETGGPGLRWAATGRENLPGRAKGGDVVAAEREKEKAIIEAASRESVATKQAAAQTETASRSAGDLVGSGPTAEFTKTAPDLGSPSSYGGGLRAVAPPIEPDLPYEPSRPRLQEAAPPSKYHQGEPRLGQSLEIPFSSTPQPAFVKDSGKDYAPGKLHYGLQDIGAQQPGGPTREISEMNEAQSERDRVANPRGGPLSTSGGGYDPSKPSFSNPVPVIRRLAQTYAGPESGKEYGTLQKANQAFNRAAGMGTPGGPEGTGYDPPEGPKLRLAAELNQRDPDKRAAADLMREQGFQKLLLDNLRKEHGVMDKERGLILPPEIERLALGHRPTSAEQVGEILKTIKPEAEAGKHLDLFNNPTTRDMARVQMLNGYRADRKAKGLPMDPTTETFIKTAPATRENIQWFQQNYKPAGAPGGAAPGVAPTAGNLPAATSYEQLTPAQGQRVRNLRQAAEAEEGAKRTLATTDVIPHMTPKEFQEDLRRKEAQREQEARTRDLRFLGQLNQPRL